MLVVKNHVPSVGNCDVYCWGEWSGTDTSGYLFDLHIDSSGAACPYNVRSSSPSDTRQPAWRRTVAY